MKVVGSWTSFPGAIIISTEQCDARASATLALIALLCSFRTLDHVDGKGRERERFILLNVYAIRSITRALIKILLYKDRSREGFLFCLYIIIACFSHPANIFSYLFINISSSPLSLIFLLLTGAHVINTRGLRVSHGNDDILSFLARYSLVD